MYNRNFIVFVSYIVSAFVIYIELYLIRLMFVIFSAVYELFYVPDGLRSSWMAHFVIMIFFVSGHEILEILIEYGDYLEETEGVETWTKKKRTSGTK